ncbi:MAG TPA: mechanosensitive ion channel [Sedimentisphaerales bacterium]|nr:mechanosensitive ion channel [Sedimentisphaerales bacterium]HRS11341.1 mechanosensitive ion channel [Sedimentisphaerales bacterium]HRV47913.1 mechanosensitive ion channel [Sedimentisphaerales bacterium]
MWDILLSWQRWLWPLVVVLLAAGTALVCHFILVKVLGHFARRSSSPVDEVLLRHLRRPARWIMVAVAVRLVVDPLGLPVGVESSAKTIFGLVLIVLVSWVLIQATYVLNDVLALRFKLDVKDNLRARKIHTQLKVLRRIIVIIIVIIASASMLMTFPKVRQLGTAIFASAGIIGIVVGLAAQKTIGTFIAGLQIAFTQPIRLDDVVIVEGEWGRIEEITLTYVVVRIWDLRRLIVPITYFIEKPFQNWTRTSADILGTVFLYVDHTVPIDAVRAELHRILEGSASWDRKVCVLQVTNTSERTVELRALMSAADASLAWDLRCEVRERLVDFIRREYPHALPRLRAELEKGEC